MTVITRMLPLCGLAIILGCNSGTGADPDDDATAPETPPLALHALADFPIGVAVPADPWPNSLLKSPERQAVVNQHFDSLTAENNMKMAYLQPQPGLFHFSDADALVDYAQSNGMIVHGHALVWHTQAPDWMNEFEGNRDEFVVMLRAHVTSVAEHFAGRLESWDVVNEAFTDDSPSTYRSTIWFDNIGPEYLELAFRAADAADPDADLYYNDYNISGAAGPAKLKAVVDMVDGFLADGVPIDGVGFQMHVDTQTPSLDDIRESFGKVVQRGLKVRISELDVAVNQNNDLTELDAATADLQRRRYEDIVRTYIEAVPENLRGGITVWGITDADSWIPGFKNRPDWPLLFNADYSPKPALTGFADGLAMEP